jgi:hypothetical protein
VHTAEFSAANRPAAQSLHLDKPGTLVIVPAVQVVQFAVPSAPAALPVGHSAQVLAPGALAKRPSSQVLQAAARLFVYVPATHVVQTDEFVGAAAPAVQL